jgi:hypothetical protein
MKCTTDFKALSNFAPIQIGLNSSQKRVDCARTVHEQTLLDHDCAQSGRTLPHFVGLAVDFLQSLALHLQFHLRILLEDLRVTLAKHLGYPLVGYSSGTQARCIG